MVSIGARNVQVLGNINNNREQSNKRYLRRVFNCFLCGDSYLREKYRL